MNFDYCNCDYDSLDVDELVSFTGKPRFKAVYTITLAELIDVGAELALASSSIIRSPFSKARCGIPIYMRY